MKKNHLVNIMNPQVVSVKPSTPVSNTIRIMRKNGISSILIVDDTKPIGIFTERDIVRSATQGKPKFEVEIHTLMTSPVITVKQGIDMYDAYQHLIINDIHHLVVIDDDDRAVGILTPTDLIAHMEEGFFDQDIKALRAMHAAMFLITEKITVMRAIQHMVHKSQSCLVVAKKNKPVGFITEREIARLLLKRTHVLKQPVQAIMSTLVPTVAWDATSQEVARIMRTQRVRQVVVLDTRGEILGLLDQSDLIKGLENKKVEILKSIISKQAHEIHGLKKRIMQTA